MEWWIFKVERPVRATAIMPTVKSTVTNVVNFSSVQQHCVALSGPKPASRTLPAQLPVELTSLAIPLPTRVLGPRPVTLIIILAPWPHRLMTPFSIASETLKLSSDVTILDVDDRADREMENCNSLLLTCSTFRVALLVSSRLVRVTDLIPAAPTSFALPPLLVSIPMRPLDNVDDLDETFLTSARVLQDAPYVPLLIMVMLSARNLKSLVTPLNTLPNTAVRTTGKVNS